MLQKQFPQVKFSVRKDFAYFIVRWKGGPSQEEIVACLQGLFPRINNIYNFCQLIREPEAGATSHVTPIAPAPKRGRKSKFTIEDIARIKMMSVTATQKTVAKQFGVSPATIRNALKVVLAEQPK